MKKEKTVLKASEVAKTIGKSTTHVYSLMDNAPTKTKPYITQVIPGTRLVYSDYKIVK